MLRVKTPEEASFLIKEAFPPRPSSETVSLELACGRVLAQCVQGREYVPGFDRSTVDGFAVRAGDTFGCSDSIPAILPLQGDILMGQQAPEPLRPGFCMAIPTGGALPQGADAVVMMEYTESYGDGTIGICKPAAPAANLIFRGDDVRPGKTVLPAGRLLTAQDIGALAAMGVTQVCVSKKTVVGILSTGDELVPVEAVPEGGQVRDVNSALLRALMGEAGASVRSYGIFRDDTAVLQRAVSRALAECDLVLISGGSSVGMKDATCRVVETEGELLFHGIAMKPGKPTILGNAGGKPIFGLPGHPVAAFFVAQLFVRPLVARLMGREIRHFTTPAVLTESVSANHGRAQYVGVFLQEQDNTLHAVPIRGKSGLITALAASDGYFCIPRDCEGVGAGETVSVTLYTAY